MSVSSPTRAFTVPDANAGSVATLPLIPGDASPATTRMVSHTAARCLSEPAAFDTKAAASSMDGGERSPSLDTGAGSDTSASAAPPTHSASAAGTCLSAASHLTALASSDEELLSCSSSSSSSSSAWEADADDSTSMPDSSGRARRTRCTSSEDFRAGAPSALRRPLETPNAVGETAALTRRVGSDDGRDVQDRGRDRPRSVDRAAASFSTTAPVNKPAAAPFRMLPSPLPPSTSTPSRVGAAGITDATAASSLPAAAIKDDGPTLEPLEDEDEDDTAGAVGGAASLPASLP